MDKKQILFRIVYALHHLHELEEKLQVTITDSMQHNLNVAEDVLFDLKLQLESDESESINVID